MKPGVREQMALAEMCLRLAAGCVDRAERLLLYYARRPDMARRVAERNQWDLYMPKGGQR